MERMRKNIVCRPNRGLKKEKCDENIFNVMKISCRMSATHPIYVEHISLTTSTFH